MSVVQAVVGQQAQERVEPQGGQVTVVQGRLHQRDGAHGPVAAELGGVEQEPGVHREQVVEGQLSGGGGAHRCWVIKSRRGQERGIVSIKSDQSNMLTWRVGPVEARLSLWERRTLRCLVGPKHSDMKGCLDLLNTHYCPLNTVWNELPTRAQSS